MWLCAEQENAEDAPEKQERYRAAESNLLANVDQFDQKRADDLKKEAKRVSADVKIVKCLSGASETVYLFFPVDDDKTFEPYYLILCL